jgi:hypothetical protein
LDENWHFYLKEQIDGTFTFHRISPPEHEDWIRDVKGQFYLKQEQLDDTFIFYKISPPSYYLTFRNDKPEWIIEKPYEIISNTPYYF